MPAKQNVAARSGRLDFATTLMWAGMIAACGLAGCGLAGCDSRPQAPSLRNGPVYQNKSAGFRFLVPEGWSQSANATLPPALDREFLLLQYRMKTTAQGGLFEVLCFDPKPDFDLDAYHAGPSHGVKAWAPREASGNATSPDVAAPAGGERKLYAASLLGNPTTKEVVSFRRGTRIFSFIGLYGDNDAAAREEIRRALESLKWEA
ncbi:MAG: hypothetical protein U0939_03655 [Pirellulales bacterium]